MNFLVKTWMWCSMLLIWLWLSLKLAITMIISFKTPRTDFVHLSGNQPPSTIKYRLNCIVNWVNGESAKTWPVLWYDSYHMIYIKSSHKIWIISYDAYELKIYETLLRFFINLPSSLGQMTFISLHPWNLFDLTAFCGHSFYWIHAFLDSLIL